MPELPEVQAVVTALTEDGAIGMKIREATVLRPSSVRPQPVDAFEAGVQGRTLQAITRRAKNILLYLSGEHVLRVHLRMTGDLQLVRKTDELPRFTRIRFDGRDKRSLLFVDARTLGKVHLYTVAEMDRHLAALGPEPLDRSFTAKSLIAAAARSRLPAKLFLMAQKKIAGLGNIYAAEALFRARLSPFTPMNQVSDDVLRKLHGAIREVLRTAIQSVYKGYRSAEGYYQSRDDFTRYVYGRSAKPCLRCRTKISRVRQGGRSTYYCGNCQKK